MAERLLTQLPQCLHSGSKLLWVSGRSPVHSKTMKKIGRIFRHFFKSLSDVIYIIAGWTLSAPVAELHLHLWNIPDCSTYPVWQHISCFHLGQVVSGGELEVVLQVDLEQGVVVTDIILCTWARTVYKSTFDLHHKLWNFHLTSTTSALYFNWNPNTKSLWFHFCLFIFFYLISLIMIIYNRV